jgi:hypothetical protein
MLEQLNDYDWEEAFGFANGGNQTYNSGVPYAIPSNEFIDTTPFDREDVIEIIAIDNGKNDESNWVGVFKLKDGRYASVNAGCDYTGWD